MRRPRLQMPLRLPPTLSLEYLRIRPKRRNEVQSSKSQCLPPFSTTTLTHHTRFTMNRRIDSYIMHKGIPSRLMFRSERQTYGEKGLTEDRRAAVDSFAVVEIRLETASFALPNGSSGYRGNEPLSPQRCKSPQRQNPAKLIGARPRTLPTILAIPYLRQSISLLSWFYFGASVVNSPCPPAVAPPII